MMDGRNCTGRKISLLNDSSDVASASAYHCKIQLPPLTHSAHSRASSCTSTPSLSPQTPQLVRSCSSDSRGFQTPSPLTPSFASFDHAHAAYAQQPPSKASQQHYQLPAQCYPNGKMDDQNGSMYPPIPDVAGALSSAYPMPPQLPQQLPVQVLPQVPPPAQPYRSSNSPASEPSRVSNVSNPSNPKSQPKKNQYPCPLAKAFNCTDYFTTSGHAARHAKKHTGKKDAYCPECNKAFTRKDNMEQHRRTHQNGRGASRSTAADDAKVKKPTKAPAKKNAAIKAEPQLEAAVEQQLAEQQAVAAVQAQPMPQIPPQQVQQPLLLEQTMMIPPAGPYFVGPGYDTGPVPALPMAMPDLNIRPTLQRALPANSLEFLPPVAPMVDPDALMNGYSQPSPGLSNGLNNLALVASEQSRLCEEKIPSFDRTPEESPQNESP
jgi:hypothetical protein